MSEKIIFIGKLASSAGAVIALVSPFILAVAKFLKNLIHRLDAIEKQLSSDRREIQNSVEERRLMLSGIYACLDGLHQIGCNGKVTAARESLNEFLIDNSHNGGNYEHLN